MEEQNGGGKWREKWREARKTPDKPTPKTTSGI